MRPRVSATSRAFSIATAAWRAKSRAAPLGSATRVEAWTAPIAPTSRSPYQSGTRFHAWSCAVPLTMPGGAARSSEFNPAQASTSSASASPLPRVALMRPSVSNAQHTVPAHSSIVRAWSAMFARTLISSWPASAASSWMRTDCASASSLAWWRRIVRSAMPTTGIAASRSLRCVAWKWPPSLRIATTPATTRSFCVIGAQTTWLGVRVKM